MPPRRYQGVLRADPNGLLDLPEGFSYQVVSRAGEAMSDGLRVPGAHDGMAAFDGQDGRIVLICNHEMNTHWFQGKRLWRGVCRIA